MEAAISVLVSQFKAFAGKDGSSDTLSRDEFQSLVVSQLPNLVKVIMDAAWELIGAQGLCTKYTK